MAFEFNPEIYYRDYLNDPLIGLPASTPIEGQAPIGVSNSSMNWISPTNAPDGVTTQFSFPSQPKYCSLNGVNQFLNKGYTQTVVGNNYLITFQDYNNNVITPASTDDIRAETL
jgi:hypothetical protein